MQYLLVENKQIVHLGPVFWNYRFIRSELEDLGIDYMLSPEEPSGHFVVNETPDTVFEIYPVNLKQPSYDSTYQQLLGPIWTFSDNIANGTYNVIDRDIVAIKNDLKSVAANERYKKEVSGIKLTIQDTEVSIATDRESRNVYTQKLVSMSESDTIQWKFPEVWLTLTRQELVSVLNSINTYVQTQYDWEVNIVEQINSAQDIETLKNIVIVEKQDNGLL